MRSVVPMTSIRACFSFENIEFHNPSVTWGIPDKARPKINKEIYKEKKSLYCFSTVLLSKIIIKVKMSQIQQLLCNLFMTIRIGEKNSRERIQIPMFLLLSSDAFPERFQSEFRSKLSFEKLKKPK